ncbi:hypothetical protein NDU88_008037 [Pleurodeles waltl]|uniref:Uncharacterized protein n=1 Tax=Pleurodeles waltl TaxID=8319 RepID=A0AAV7PQJ0_PLEWA|nr:hypothetical protein NDU88_008037 [Pleurodeles waltl]
MSPRGSPGPPTPCTTGLLHAPGPRYGPQAADAGGRGLFSGATAECSLVHQRGLERPYTAGRRCSLLRGAPAVTAAPWGSRPLRPASSRRRPTSTAD